MIEEVLNCVEIDEEVPYTIIENYLFNIQGLSANKKLFFLMLRKYAGANIKPAFPSYKTLMDDIGVSKRALISKCIDFFIWLKWLEKINRKNDNGSTATNYYIIRLKNVRIVLEHFEKNKINFKEVEKFFEEEYKKDSKKIFLSKPCKYFVE